MYIERVQVEEGFLAGLDVHFGPGLNAVIGARGTGKTSLIELIRFCIDAGGTSQDSNRRSREHALSILGSGQVTLTLVSENERILVTRTAEEATPRASAPFVKPIVYSQTEIETVGLTPAGRVGLVDSFLPTFAVDPEALPSAEVRSISSQIEQCRREIEELGKQVSELPVIDTQLEAAVREEQVLAAGSSNLSVKTANLQQISQILSGQAGHLASMQTVEQALGAWYQQLESARTVQFNLTGLPDQLQRNEASSIETARQKISEALQLVAASYHSVHNQSQGLSAQKLDLETKARQLRAEIDTLQAGAGTVMRKGQELRERKAKMEVVSMRMKALQASLDQLLVARNAALDRLDGIRSERSQARESVVAALNGQLSPNIRIKVIRNGQAPAFAATISDVLRGSGLKYGEIVNAIARQLTPRALVKAVDDFDWELIALVADIPVDRASRILTYLRAADLGAIATLNVDDDIEFQLLDGRDYKDFGELSTGQRCTVVLPILLSHTHRILIVDQPEDHIDNAFITSTLIRSILTNAGYGQIIFSTHNPNIPVLGNASSVLHLGSDGRRGYALASGPLQAPHIVSAISSVMEGGADAFAYRARFYSTTGAHQ